jgi:hypothetical protein
MVVREMPVESPVVKAAFPSQEKAQKSVMA